MYFDRIDICEAYFLLECDYNVNGIVWERPSNRRRSMSTGYQLSRMGYKMPPNLTYATLTINGKKIFKTLEKRYGFKS